MKIDTVYGQTPLGPDDIAGLIPKLSTVGELNQFEAANIAEAMAWLEFRDFSVDDVLSATFLHQLHRRMLGKTWKWAGEQRTRDLNFGVDPSEVNPQLAQLIDNVKYWDESKVYSVKEIAVRFHHGLTWVHFYRNGNGRHARLITDIYLAAKQVDSFSWRGSPLVADDEKRREYIAALREADQKLIFDRLLKFAEEKS